MNDKGQLLTYDMIFAVLILFIVIIAVNASIDWVDDTKEDYSISLDTIILLSSIEVHGESLLEALSNNDPESQIIVRDILSDRKYTLRDLTLDKNLSSNFSPQYNEIISARKTVKNHEYELNIYI